MKPSQEKRVAATRMKALGIIADGRQPTHHAHWLAAFDLEKAGLVTGEESIIAQKVSSDGTVRTTFARRFTITPTGRAALKARGEA